MSLHAWEFTLKFTHKFTLNSHILQLWIAIANLRSGVPYIFCRGGKVRLIQLLDYLSVASPESGLFSDWSRNKRVLRTEPWLVTFVAVWFPLKNPASWWIPSWRLMRRAKRASFLNASLQTFVHKTLKDEQIECIHRIACHGRDVLAVLPMGLGKSAICISPFSLIHDFRKQNARGNVSNISVNHTCYRQIGSKSTNHSPLALRREGLKVTLTAVIGEFRSDLSITRRTSGNSAWFSGDGIADIRSDRYFN